MQILCCRGCNVGEDMDEAGEGLAHLITVGASLRQLRLKSNLLGKLDWRRQQITRALAANEALTELDLSDNGLERQGIKYVCTALQTCKALILQTRAGRQLSGQTRAGH